MNSQILQGSVTKVRVKCQEEPFFINNAGDIVFKEQDDVVLEVIGKSKLYSNEIVKGMNWAFKMGFEQDRFEFK